MKVADDVIVMDGICKNYHNGVESLYALRDVSVSIARNEYIAIVGASGSGKSTMMNIIGCLDRPTSGNVLFEGRPTAHMSDADLSRIRNQHIGFIFQSYSLLPKLTALENVAQPLVFSGVGRRDRLRMAAAMIERVGLESRSAHYPNQLSGGQQQRVAIARALVNNPSVILADEPTGNLDSASGQVVLELFDAIHQDGNTIVMVTHDHSIAERCGRIVKICDGVIVT
jgi:putative ABC transport system ATP-binding protein